MGVTQFHTLQMMVWMPAKLEALQAALAQRRSAVGPAKARAQSSAWVQTLKNVGATVPVLGFIFINMVSGRRDGTGTMLVCTALLASVSF